MKILHDWDALSVATLAMEKHHAKSIISEDLEEKEVCPKSLDYVPNIIGEILVFMDLDAKPSRRSTESPSTICWKSPLEDLRDDD